MYCELLSTIASQKFKSKTQLMATCYSSLCETGEASIVRAGHRQNHKLHFLLHPTLPLVIC